MGMAKNCTFFILHIRNACGSVPPNGTIGRAERRKRTAIYMRIDFDKARNRTAPDLTADNWVGLNLEAPMIGDFGPELLEAFDVGLPMPPLWQEMDEAEWQEKSIELQRRGLIGMYIRDPEKAYEFLAADGRDGYAEADIWQALHKEFGPEEEPEEERYVDRLRRTRGWQP